MSKIELLAKIELLNKYEAMMDELKAEADKVRDSIKAEMEAREVEELIAGQYIIRYTAVLSNRFDSTSFKKVLPDLYKAYTKQVAKAICMLSVPLLCSGMTETIISMLMCPKSRVSDTSVLTAWNG